MDEEQLVGKVTDSVDTEQVNLAEVYFLIADFLKRFSPCQESASLLTKELVANGLLNETVDWQGKRKAANYTDVALRHRFLAKDHLLVLLGKTLTQQAKSLVTQRCMDMVFKEKDIEGNRQRRALAHRIISSIQNVRGLERTILNVKRLLSHFGLFNEQLSRFPLTENSDGDLAAEKRAEGQLISLETEKKTLTDTVEQLVQQVKKTRTYYSKRNSMRNQFHQLRNREIGFFDQKSQQPLSYVYSRIRRVKTVSGHLQIPVYCMAFDKKGKFVITGSDDRLVKIWSVQTSHLLHTLRGHLGNITDLAISAQNNLLATSSDDKTIRVWELQTGFPVAVLVGHKSVINCVRFHPQVDIVVSASDDGLCHVYTLPSIRLPSSAELELEKRDYRLTTKRLVVEKAYCLNLSPRYLLNHNLITTNIAISTSNSTRCNKVLCLTRDGEMIATGAQDGNVRIWSIKKRKVRKNNIDPIPNVDPDEYIPSMNMESSPDSSTASTPLIHSNAIGEEIEDGRCISVLKGHSAPVTNLFYSHGGDRLASACIKDGTARVWSLSKKQTNVQKCWIFYSSGQSSLNTTLPSLSQNSSVDMLMWTCNDHRLVTLHSRKPTESNSSTTASSSAHPPSITVDWHQNLKIWDPSAGVCLMTLGRKTGIPSEFGHFNASFTMDVHPRDWRVVMTAGYDGRLFLWDIEKGTILKKYVNYETKRLDSAVSPVLDGGFAAVSDLICVTDRSGRLHYFSSDAKENWAMSPPEQYFASDYASVELDSQLNVRETETQLPPHFNREQPLTDLTRKPYQHQRQQLQADYDYEEYRQIRLQQSKEATAAYEGEIEDVENESAYEDYPCCILYEKKYSNNPKQIPALSPPASANIYRLNGEEVSNIEIASSRRRAGRGRRRRNSNQSDERDTSILNMEISSDEENDEEYHNIATIEEEYSLDDDDDEDDDEEVELIGDEEVYLTRRRRDRGRPTINTEEDEIYSMRNRRTSSRRRGGRRIEESSISSSEGAEEENEEEKEENKEQEVEENVIVASNDGAIVDGNQLDRFDKSTTYFKMLIEKKQLVGINKVAELNEEDLISCGFCQKGDCGPDYNLPGILMGNYPVIWGKNQRCFVHDQCAISSPLCFRNEGKWYNVAKELRRGRSLSCTLCSIKGATIGCAVEECRETFHWKCVISYSWNSNVAIHFYCERHQSHAVVNSTSQSGNGKETNLLLSEAFFARHSGEELPGKRLGLHFNRLWLQNQGNAKQTTYVPQVGDCVVYLPQGHEAYLRNFPSSTTTVFNQYTAVKCHLRRIKYVFPPVAQYVPKTHNVIQCQLHLQVLSAIPKVQEGDSSLAQFNNFVELSQPQPDLIVLHHPSALAEFLVLESKYARGLRLDWALEDQVLVPFVTYDEDGNEKETQHYLARIIDMDTTSSCAPWECMRLLYRNENSETEKISISPWEMEISDLTLRNSHDRNENMKEEKQKAQRNRLLLSRIKDKLLHEMERIMALSLSAVFLDPVPDSVPDYTITVANPVDLTLIRNRIANGYYRQVGALIAQVRLLCSNCELYNVETSEIAADARKVRDSLLNVIQQCIDQEHSVIDNLNFVEEEGMDEDMVIVNNDLMLNELGGSQNVLHTHTEYKKEHVLADLSSADLKQIQRLNRGEELDKFLGILHMDYRKDDREQFFAVPVSDEFAPQYSEIIQHPMDFSLIQHNIGMYDEFDDYLKDLLLVFSNAKTYNRPGDLVYVEADRLEKKICSRISTALKKLHRGNNSNNKKKLRSISTNRQTVKNKGKGRLRRSTNRKVVTYNEDEDSFSDGALFSSSASSSHDDVTSSSDSGSRRISTRQLRKKRRNR